jgi:hypothetical protein
MLVDIVTQRDATRSKALQLGFIAWPVQQRAMSAIGEALLFGLGGESRAWRIDSNEGSYKCLNKYDHSVGGAPTHSKTSLCRAPHQRYRYLLKAPSTHVRHNPWPFLSAPLEGQTSIFESP